MTDTPSPTPEEIEAAADAIEKAQCLGREGPFGLYDYSSYDGNSPPHVVRDFRDLKSERYGKSIFSSWNGDEAKALYDKLTRNHIAEAAIKAAMAVRRGK